MTNLARDVPLAPVRRRRQLDLAAVALGGLLMVTTTLNFIVYRNTPLSIDEVWTGMIAAQSSMGGLIRQCQLDVNAPLAYVLQWLWAPIGGLSNAGLRLPSTLFVCATPLLALAPRRLAPRTVRFTWAALLACWLPALTFAQQARCYGLILLLATASTISFARLMRRPSLGAAILWCSIAALLILGHYFALILAACQGLAYLVIHREKAVRTWPAALAFIPALISLAWKAAELSHFAKPGVSWIDRLDLDALPSVLGFLTGGRLLAVILAMGLVAGLVAEIRARRWDAQPAVTEAGAAENWTAENRAALRAAALAAVLATGLSIGLGFVFPILTPRYLTFGVPGLLLGMALMAGRFARNLPIIPALLATSAFVFVLRLGALAILDRPPAPDGAFSFEPAASSLIARRPQRLVFFWDNPVAQGGDTSQLAQVGGFFFTRAGHPIIVDAVSDTRGADPNTVLLSKARAPGTDILWMFDRDVDGTAAVAYPPDISRRDPRWACRDFGGGGDIGILACHRRAPV